jgi:8-oxo-dGTP pyrophosphatase MutT (NUDIX family)
MNKRTRVGAIIESPKGVILAIDARDDRKYSTDLSNVEYNLQEAIMLREVALAIGSKKKLKHLDEKIRRLELARLLAQKGRGALPGGSIEEKDCQIANATSLIISREESVSPEGEPRIYLMEPKTDQQIALYQEAVNVAICREVLEEFGLIVDKESIQRIMEIQGRTRNHVICLVKTIEGVIKLDKKELNGIGFLSDQPVIPLNPLFYQRHLLKVYAEYIMKDPSRRAKLAMEYLSPIQVPRDIIDKWYSHLHIGYEYASLGKGYKYPEPTPFRSSPNFTIIGPDGTREKTEYPGSFTSAATAKIVPPPDKR